MTERVREPRKPSIHTLGAFSARAERLKTMPCGHPLASRAIRIWPRREVRIYCEQADIEGCEAVVYDEAQLDAALREQKAPRVTPL